MAHFLNRSSIGLIKGSSTRGWDNVIKKMLRLFKSNHSIIAITNDGPKGPPKKAKLGSYKIALKANAQIIAISCNSTSYWEAKSWDRLRLPKPFGMAAKKGLSGYTSSSAEGPSSRRHSPVYSADGAP